MATRWIGLQRVIGVAALAISVGCVPSGGGGDGDGNPNDGGFGNFGGNGSGGMNGGGGPGSVGDVDITDGSNDDTMISDLSADDVLALCEEVTAQAANAVPEEVLHQVTCISLAVLSGFFDMNDPVAACEGAYDMCLAQPPEPEEGEPCRAEAIPGCMVTVGQAEACLNAQFAALGELVQTFDCAVLAEPEGAEEPEEPAACVGLAEACPELFGDDEDEFPEE